MTPEEAISVSCEQKQYWRNRGITAGAAWTMLTGKTARRGESWIQVEAYMIRWLLRKREDEERWAA